MADPLPFDRGVLLPRPLTRLLGRQAELAAARRALLVENVPLLSLVGTGGVGKTRLALAVAADVAGSFADGVVWVDLAPLTGPALVPGALANALEITPPAEHTVLETLVHHLRQRQTLLLLDNCEHVIAATAEAAASLLAACPALQILATSRAPLRIRGEQQFLVEPLPLPPAYAESLEHVAQNDAVRLFVERAHAVRSGFVLSATNAASVAAVCRRLDGLPLAIELAAARSKILSPEALLAQMTDRLRLLSWGHRDVPPRQQTIEATIAWSYALLAPDAHRLFRLLGVFAGGCDLEAAAAVAAGHKLPVLDGLGELCDQGLLRVTEAAGGDRYLMLETVHEYARERLELSGEAANVRDAHAAHFLARAEMGEAALRGPDQAPWLRRLEADYPNFLAALRWLRESGQAELALRLAGALFHFWQMRNDFSEGRQRLQDVLALPGLRRTAAWAKAQTALGYMLHNGNDVPRARALLEEALAVWRELGDQRGIAMALMELATVLMDLGELDHARALGAEALAICRARGDDFGSVYMLFGLGVVALRGGDYPRARLAFAESLQLAEALGPTSVSMIGRGLGWLMIAEGDEAGAAAVWEKRLADGRAAQLNPGIVSSLDDLGWLALRRGDWRRAAGFFAEEVAFASQQGYQWHMARAFVGLAVVSAETGHAGHAAWLLGAAEATADIDDVLDEDAFHQVRTPYARTMAAARRALGAAAFAAAWRIGRDLPRHHAVAKALAAVAAAGAALTGDANGASAELEPLTPREAEILRLMVQRQTDREISDVLYISRRTVNTHVARILNKLRVDNRRDAGAAAVRLGLV